MAEINAANRTLFEGDNLPVLRGLNSESIDLIATDPPFNKGRDFHATPDSLAAGAKFEDRWKWDEEVHKPWVDGLHDELEAWAVIESARLSHSDEMGAFLCFIGVRLLEMRRVLKPTGSIYLHCDPTASHYLKALMDAVFGRRQFRNEIVWCYTGPGSPKMRQFNRKHDIIFWYAKGSEWAFNADAVRVPYKNPKQMPRKEFDTGTSFDPAQIEAMRMRGKVPETWWPDFPIVARFKSIEQGGQRTGYPTQKPLALYDRIIRASSNEGDWVLDPFAGCATTCVAAEAAGRKWVAIDLWDGAAQVTRDRLASASSLAGRSITASGGEPQSQLETYPITHRTDVPVRTDAGEVASAHLQTPVKGQRRPRLMPDSEIKARLIQQFGLACWGCTFVAPTYRYLELDHDKPRKTGGSDEIDNRSLLCGPCNRDKRDGLTLQGLRDQNGVKAHAVDLKAASRWRREAYEDALLAARSTQ